MLRCKIWRAKIAEKTCIMNGTWHPFIILSGHSGQLVGYVISKLLWSIGKKGYRMRIDSAAAANGDGCSPTKFRPRPNSLNEWHRSWVLCFSDGDVGRSAVHIPALGARFSSCHSGTFVSFVTEIIKLALTYAAFVSRLSWELSILFIFFWT